MPDETVPTHDYDYADGPVYLAVDLAGGGPLRVYVKSGGCALSFDLSILGGQRLTSMLDTAMSKAISRGFRG